MDDSFIGAIIGVHHQWQPALGERLSIHSKAMVLRGDVAALSPEVDNGLIHAPVPKLHLEGLGSSCKGKNLIPKADAEDWSVGPLLHHLLEVLDGLGALTWVTGPVAEEEAIEVLLREVVVPRHHGQLNPKTYQAADDVVLHATIHSQYVDIPPTREGLPLPPRNLCHKVAKVWVLKRGGARAALDEDATEHCTFLADDLGDHARVHPIDARHALTCQPVPQGAHAGVVGRLVRVVGDDDGLHMDAITLKPL